MYYAQADHHTGSSRYTWADLLDLLLLPHVCSSPHCFLQQGAIGAGVEIAVRPPSVASTQALAASHFQHEGETAELCACTES